MKHNNFERRISHHITILHHTIWFGILHHLVDVCCSFFLNRVVLGGSRFRLVSRGLKIVANDQLIWTD